MLIYTEENERGRPKARLTLRDLRFKYTCMKQPPQVNVFFCLGLVHLVNGLVLAKPWARHESTCQKYMKALTSVLDY
jgi:hypothetical protein